MLCNYQDTSLKERTGEANCSSIAAILSFNSLYVNENCLKVTKALIIEIFTSIAFSLFRTLDSIAIPCSVNAKGIYRTPPLFEVTICDLKLLNSIQ